MDFFQFSLPLARVHASDINQIVAPITAKGHPKNNGLKATSKIEQNNYTAILGYRPPYVVSSVAKNSQLYGKFAIARAITNQNWLSGLNATAAS